MAVELDVFVGNTTIMDEEVYQLWLDGYTGMDVYVLTVFTQSWLVEHNVGFTGVWLKTAEDVNLQAGSRWIQIKDYKEKKQTNYYYFLL